jgi:hypothetical protein
MRLFHLVRKIDETGISGTGIVAEGIQFWNGKCVMCWKTQPATSVAVYDSIDALITIHGHQGKTIVEWIRNHHFIHDGFVEDHAFYEKDALGYVTDSPTVERPNSAGDAS